MSKYFLLVPGTVRFRRFSGSANSMDDSGGDSLLTVWHMFIKALFRYFIAYHKLSALTQSPLNVFDDSPFVPHRTLSLIRYSKSPAKTVKMLPEVLSFRQVLFFPEHGLSR